ncbi:sugar-binding protein [Rhodopirellula sp. SWK7]|uniref:sugar-binding protein n=1 Tax=Rhodopirellula sp. SWK7 TaxID=595460 RepID=UPI00034C9711|nr:sugar-binding protein [Rhodopirellula sp. SWK7]
MNNNCKLLLCCLSVIWLGFVSTASATQTDNRGLHAVPVPDEVVIDGNLADWDLSGQTLMCYDLESLQDVCSAKVAVMYDAANLYISVHFADTTPMGNRHDPRYQAHKAWAGDSVQVRFKTERISHITAWYFAGEKKPGFYLDRGKDLNTPFGGGAETLFHQEGWKLERGVETAYQKDSDEQGYVQEMKLPWSLVTDRKYEAGDQLQLGFELFWGQGDWPSHRYADNLSEGANGREFFFTNHKGWGDLILEAEGNLNLPKPAWMKRQIEGQPTGPVEIEYELSKDGKVTLAIDDSDGRRVRNLIAAQSRTAGKNIEKWDGLDDAGTPVLPGDYRFHVLTHDGIHLKYALSFANPGNPTWSTDDGRGAFYGDHTAPQAAAAAGKFVALATPMGEAGKHLIATDLDGQRLWGLSNRVAFDGGHISLATDGTTLWVGTEGKQSLIYRVTLADGSYVPWGIVQKDNDGHEFRPVDLVVSELPGLAAAKAEANLRSIAWHHDVLAAAFARENEVRLYHAVTGELLSRIAIDEPKSVAYTSQSELLVLSKGRILIVDDKAGIRPFTTQTHADAWGLAVGADGRVYLSVRGTDQNVKVFSADGKPLREIGKRGGRPHHGQFIAGAMRQPAGIAIDSRNHLWVTEETENPKRTSVWNVDSGGLLKDLSGTTSYAGAGTVNPYDPSMGFADDTVYRLDWETGTSKPIYSVGKTENPDDLFPPSVHNLTSRVVQKNGLLYVYTTGAGRGSSDVHCTVFDGTHWRSVAHTGVVGHGQANQGRFSKYEHLFAGRDRQRYSWADENGDGLVQESELQFARIKINDQPVDLRSFYWGQLPDTDGTITYAVKNRQELVQFPVAGYTKAGAPIYDITKPHIVRPDREIIGGGNGEGQIIGGSNGRIYINQDPLIMVEPSGRVVGGYPNRHLSVHGSHRAKAARSGYLIGPSSFLGVIQVGDESKDEAGEIFCLNGNLGENYLFTHDGLFVQSLFRDTRGYSEKPARAERGMSLDATTAGGESFGGNFIRTAEGKTYLTNGGTDARVIEVTGLESIRRISGKFTYTHAEFAEAQTLLSQKLAETSAPKAFTVPRGTANVDGEATEWPALMDDEQLAMNVQENTRQRYARVLARYDDQNLYLAYRVFAPRSAMKNVGQDDRLLFKTGDAVDLMIGPDGAKDDAGNLRLLMTFKDRKTPIAVLNVKKAPGAAASEKFDFSSPWRTISFDRVVVTRGVTLASAGTQGGFIVEASIPWNEIGITPESGLKLKADVGVLFSDGGTQTVSRQYWSNKATGLVNDIPGEADLVPAGWGTFTLE